ncbi:MAG TPA: sirohydrochlorin chelatase [Gemmataceae bacterium]|nr:sirohydrochlorin chelatase [Gemmataceae bacterium]
MKPAVLFVGHGSRDAEGTQEFLQIVELFRARDPERVIECGFLEFARPVIDEGVSRCVERGARTVAVLPGMLMAAGHAKNDIPSEIHEARRRYPDVSFHYGRHLHLHPNIVQLCRLRIEETERAAAPAERKDTLLLVVGRGSSDPDANADVAKLARLLWEGMGFGWGSACYIGVTTPLLPEALERCQRMGFRRVVVFPFFLFTGVLEKRIRRQTEEFGRQHPGSEFLCAGYLNVHPLLFDAFAERAEEAVHGSPNMNCELCKYRVRLPGFEEAVGQPQVGHHHHVRGIGQDEEGDHHHGHGHGHGHHH